jgi:hypothetical protein
MDDVVAVALITGSVGAAGSIATFLGTRHSADQQASTERERIRSELDRLRLEQQEPHFQHRQAVYHDLLDILGHWHTKQSTGSWENVQEALRWMIDSEHCFNAVALFGTPEAYDASERLKQAVEAGMGADPFVSSPEESAFLAAFSAAVDAMRQDTAPDR